MRRLSDERGPWWARTWWGKRTAAVNITLLAALILLVVWKAFFS
jgi:hypothetical protein